MTDEAWRETECMRLIHALRRVEGDEVTILGDNPDFGGPNNAVECCGDWTDYADRRFTGESLLDALSAAAIAAGRIGQAAPLPAAPPAHIPTRKEVASLADAACDRIRSGLLSSHTAIRDGEIQAAKDELADSILRLFAKGEAK